MYFKYEKKGGKAFFLCLSHFQINFIQSALQLRAWCNNETDERIERRNLYIQMSIFIQECYLAIKHLFFSNSILNYLGRIYTGNYLFCGSVWQEVHKLEHHWYVCITCHDKDVGLDGNFQLSLYFMDEKTEIQKTEDTWWSHRAFHLLKRQWENEKGDLNRHFTELFNICNSLLLDSLIHSFYKYLLSASMCLSLLRMLQWTKQTKNCTSSWSSHSKDSIKFKSLIPFSIERSLF